MFKFMDNDTVALIFLGVVALAGVFLNQENVSSIALGAIGGYVGSQVLNKEQ